MEFACEKGQGRLLKTSSWESRAARIPSGRSLELPSTSRSQENGRDWSVNPKITHIDGLEELWAETHGDPRITVAVLDGPVDRSHPALIGAVLEEVPTPCSAEHYDARAFAHGTHVASVIFG